MEYILPSSWNNILSYQAMGKRTSPMRRIGRQMVRRQRGRTRTAMQGRQRATKMNAAKTTGTNNPYTMSLK